VAVGLNRKLHSLHCEFDDEFTKEQQVRACSIMSAGACMPFANEGPLR
jgi:hypothetical protein